MRLLSSSWTHGRLTVTLPDGSEHHLEGREPGRSAVMVISDWRSVRRAIVGGDIGFAEGYMAGEWDSPHLATLLEAFADNYDRLSRLVDGNPVLNAVNRVAHGLNRNSRRGSQRNIHAHYDLGNAFYGAWLDPSMTYSAARFSTAEQSLEQAQKAKYARLASIMDLRRDQTVLEIGCGWGGFAEYAAREVGAQVTAITISREQHDFARRRMHEAGLSERADIQLIDYRDVQGRFDRVASIEMFEAVGEQYWPDYFATLRRVLVPGGRAGLQIITIRDDLFEGYRRRPDFIQKYVFPGGMLPSEPRLQPVIAGAGLDWDITERFGGDYAATLDQWGRRFEAAWAGIAAGGRFDVRFRRLWLFYLAYCEAGFRSGRTDVIQIGLSAAGDGG
nr:cyclopropane-fatty-acyl-phospholipid synthase family protein [Brevundimonas alba]